MSSLDPVLGASPTNGTQPVDPTQQMFMNPADVLAIFQGDGAIPNGSNPFV
jgi:hypothetical protein